MLYRPTGRYRRSKDGQQLTSLSMARHLPYVYLRLQTVHWWLCWGSLQHSLRSSSSIKDPASSGEGRWPWLCESILSYANVCGGCGLHWPRPVTAVSVYRDIGETETAITQKLVQVCLPYAACWTVAQLGNAPRRGDARNTEITRLIK